MTANKHREKIYSWLTSPKSDFLGGLQCADCIYYRRIRPNSKNGDDRERHLELWREYGIRFQRHYSKVHSDLVRVLCIDQIDLFQNYFKQTQGENLFLINVSKKWFLTGLTMRWLYPLQTFKAQLQKWGWPWTASGALELWREYGIRFQRHYSKVHSDLVRVLCIDQIDLFQNYFKQTQGENLFLINVSKKWFLTGLTMRWLYPLQTFKAQLQKWGWPWTASGALELWREYGIRFQRHYSKVHSDLVRVLCIDQIDLFHNYFISIGPCTKITTAQKCKSERIMNTIPKPLGIK